MTPDLRSRAERAAIERLSKLNPPAQFMPATAGCLDDWHDNLIAGVTPAGSAADLRTGPGGELNDQSGDPARFRAASASSALTVNTFGPFRRRSDLLAIGGLSGFTATQFEYQCPNAPPGTKLHFDFWGAAPHCVLAIESKFLEPLEPPQAELSAQYVQPFVGSATAAAIAEARWAAAFRALCNDPKTYRHLDAASLIKCYLGLKQSYPDRRRVLIYLFWEPTNASALAEYRAHRNEVEDFAARVSGLETSFVALSYSDLWREWETSSTWPGMPVHVSRLRARYGFAI